MTYWSSYIFNLTNPRFCLFAVNRNLFPAVSQRSLLHLSVFHFPFKQNVKDLLILVDLKEETDALWPPISSFENFSFGR